MAELDAYVTVGVREMENCDRHPLGSASAATDIHFSANGVEPSGTLESGRWEAPVSLSTTDLGHRRGGGGPG